MVGHLGRLHVVQVHHHARGQGGETLVVIVGEALRADGGLVSLHVLEGDGVVQALAPGRTALKGHFLLLRLRVSDVHISSARKGVGVGPLLPLGIGDAAGAQKYCQQSHSDQLFFVSHDCPLLSISTEKLSLNRIFRQFNKKFSKNI